MEMIYFTNIEVSKKILENIPKEKNFGFSLFEDRLEIESELSDDLDIDSEGFPFIQKYSVDNCTTLFIWDGFANVSVDGMWKVSSYFEMAKFFGMKDEMLDSISKMENPSCALDSKEIYKNEKVSEFISEIMKSSLVVGEDEW